jgi:hypothetical protein
MGYYNNSSQWVFPTGNLGSGVYLTQKQMQELVNHLLTGSPMKTYSKAGFGLDPKLAVMMFYSKERILKIYEEERPRVKAVHKPATIFAAPYTPPPTEVRTLESFGINLNDL